MLTLHLEAGDHSTLVSLAMKTLGLPAPHTAADAPPPPPPPPSVELPIPASRATRTRKTPAPLPEAPVAAATPQPVALSPAPAAPAVAAPVASASSPAAVPTIDEVRYALSEVNGIFGMAVCTSMLGEYGAERVSLVPEAKRAEFIKACNDKVAAEKARLAAQPKAA